MPFILDTDTSVFALRNAFGVNETIEKTSTENCFLSEITVAELKFGAVKSNRREERLKAVDFFCSRFIVLPISEVLDTYAEERAKLEKQGLPLDDFDLLIGATAIYYHLTLVTNNTKHFQRLPVQLVNWKQEK